MRIRHLAIMLGLAVIALTVLAPPSMAAKRSLRELKADLREARQHLGDARTQAAAANAALAAALLPGSAAGEADVAALRARAADCERVARRLATKVRRLARRVHRREQIARWARKGRWRPLIKIAARRFGVSPGGLHRLMVLESSGQRRAGTTYKGLFQYYPSNWTKHWNPWRHASIFNGWAQIQATAYAISRGMGPSQWPNTYPMAF